MTFKKNKKIEQMESALKSYGTLLEKVNRLESRINP
jgi:hypothetical protein